MRKLVLLAVLFVLTIGTGVIFLRGDAALALAAAYVRPMSESHEMQAADGHLIKDFVVFDDKSGLVYTVDALFRTDDGGATWRELRIDRANGETIAAVLFSDKQRGAVLLSAGAPSPFALELARTNDGGIGWTRTKVTLENADFYELDPGDVALTGDLGGKMELIAGIPTSSNFVGRVTYSSNDGGATWQFVSRSTDLSTDEQASAITRKGGWSVETSGDCAAFKTGCIQETKLAIAGKEATPPALKARLNLKRAAARTAAEKQALAAPGGSIRTSLNRGFDKCQAGSVAQMKLWWDNSYFFDTNIYFSGRNRACPSQPFTGNPAWIDQVSQMGWGIIPTVVGYQSPCTSSTTTAKLSYDTAIAQTQGRGEADIAVTDAAAIGLTAGSVLYYDMERYDETTATPGCRTATVAFLKGWTDRIHELGYVSGVYGSPSNAVPDWYPMPAASRPDAIWMARYDNVMSVWVYNSPSPAFPADAWVNHQRIKQWQGGHNETWGGVTFNIDSDIADGPVAGVPVAKNKVADFDGDGKTDLSVFRPGAGQWFIYGSLGPSYKTYQYATAEDIPVPGDYDGDGKTDLVVFRPSNSTWYVLAKGAFTFRQYGEPGDVPAQADYDGDGRTDIAVFRPSTGMWYLAFSDSRRSIGQVQFGQNGDRPAAADYDGDGKADIAVWRPSDGNWYVLGSSGGYSVTTLGTATDIPAQADYDGDGKADPAVFSPAAGTWQIRRSTEGAYTQQFGQDGDIPVTGDYDGDGRYDIAVFRPSNGTWYLSESVGGYYVQAFGAADDKPLPRAYLPQ